MATGVFWRPGESDADGWDDPPEEEDEMAEQVAAALVTTADALGELRFDGSTGAILAANGAHVAQVNAGGAVDHRDVGALLVRAPILAVQVVLSEQRALTAERAAHAADELVRNVSLLLLPYGRMGESQVQTLARLLNEIEPQTTETPPLADAPPPSDAEVEEGIAQQTADDAAGE